MTETTLAGEGRALGELGVPKLSDTLNTPVELHITQNRRVPPYDPTSNPLTNHIHKMVRGMGMRMIQDD